jgi:hypothetical protein
MRKIYLILNILLISSMTFAQKVALFTEKFPAAEDFAKWTNETTPPNGGSVWVYTDASNAGHLDRTSIDIYTHATEDNDAWIFSPAINLKAGVSYDLTFWVRLFSVQPRPRIAVGIATATNRNAVIDTIYDSSTDFNYGYGTAWREQKVSYTPESNGTYYIGFLGNTPKKDGATGAQDHALVDDIKLEGPVDNNITLIKGFPHNYRQIPVSQNIIAAKIQNTGIETQTNVTFGAVLNNGSPIATDTVASLAPGATSDFSITSGVTFVKGENSLIYSASQSETDNYPDDNTNEHAFTGTDVVYATEALKGEDFAWGDKSFSKTIGNIYKIVNQTTLTGVAGGFGEHSTYPLTFTIALYRLNGDLTVESAPLFSQEVTRKAAAGLYTFPLTAPQTLTPGDYYLAIENGIDGIIGTGAIKNMYEKTDNTLALSGTNGTLALRMVLQAADCNITPVPATPVPGIYSVTLAWNTDADAYQYKVTLTYNGTNSIYTSYDKSITINGLPSGTNFTWTVAAICDPTLSGTPVAGESFSTISCSEFVSEGFNATFPPSECWLSYGLDGSGNPYESNKWRIAETPTRPENINPQEGSGMLELDCYNISSNGKGIIISPAFTYADQMQLSFWMYHSSESETEDSVNIYMSPVVDIAGLTPIKTVYRNKNLSPVESGSDGWYQYNVSLQGETGAKYHIGIEGVSKYGYSNIYIDNVKLLKPVKVTQLIPENESTVDLDGIDFPGYIQARFEKAITLGDTSTIKATVNNVPYPVSRQSSGSRLMINVPEGYFAPSTTYNVVIPAGLINEIYNDIAWTFTTAPALAIETKTPAQGAVDIALDAEVSVEFNKGVRIPGFGDLPQATITAGNISVSNVNYSVDESGKKLMLTHDNFEYNTLYTVNIPVDVLTAYKEEITWSFTTENGNALGKIKDSGNVYPTLTKGAVNVNCAPKSIVSIMDIYGKTVATYHAISGKLDLDLNYANGIYLIVINDGKYISTHKVCLQK